MDHLVGPGINSATPRGFKVKIFCNDSLLDVDQNNCLDGARSFHQFPDLKGWKIDGGILIPGDDAQEPGVEEWTKGTASDSMKEELRSAFVQRWLFFGLLRAIFWEDPEFSYGDFMKKDPCSQDEDRITTENLKAYLTRWAKRGHDRARFRARFVRDQAVLQRAREIVSEHCAFKVPAVHVNNWAVSRNVTFSVIILGESLSRVITQFYTPEMEQMFGWKDPVLAKEHWGYSPLVLEKMEERIKCRREIAVIHAFFHGNAAGPLLAFLNVGFFENHHSCYRPEMCMRYSYAQQIDPAIAQNGDSTQSKSSSSRLPRHQGGFCLEEKLCHMVKSNPHRLAEIIRSNEVPLLSFNDPNSNHDCAIEASDLGHHDFIVFSHVWVDGFGNGKENGIHECVFRFLKTFRDRFHQRKTGPSPTYFWLDTLSLPVGEGFQEERNLGIRKIHEIYRRATWTIVLDEILLQEFMEDYTQAAIRISVSRWMSRLWTLQEAFLSRKLYFAFKHDGHPRYKVFSMGEIQRGLEYQRQIENEPQPLYISEVASSYRDRILFHWRPELRRQSLDTPNLHTPFVTPSFVADVWKAVQFRSSGRRADEALALAILFNLEVNDLPDHQRELDQDECDERMEIILRQLAKQNSIPPGIIFIGGPRLNRVGFRWAPQSWMSSAPIPSPHPLDQRYWTNSSKLSFEPKRNTDEMQGLQVQFPGFMLHPMSSKGQANIFINDMEIRFPAGYDTNNSNNWFRIEKADQQDDYEMRDRDEQRELAIIALTLDQAHPKTIALLVAVESKISAHIVVKVLCRVWLLRMQASEKVEELKTDFHQDLGAHFCAEQKLPNTQWCVAGRGPEPDPVPAREPLLMGRRSNTLYQFIFGASER
ncbi:MAG: hypothetical protein M1831_001954 [Alyxoria varia]|nr:MAG: hypothetical protein M1831_001954 [Alyxoria varia]